MGLLENIQSGRENRPPRIMIYGSEGVGKSTFGANAPKPIFIQTEDGLGEINCHKFPLEKSVSEVIAELVALRDEHHDFQTVIIDSADWLERLIFDEVCREYGVRSIEKADGGYGRGYTHAVTHWRRVVGLLSEWVDAVLFANKKFWVQKENDRSIAAPIGADGGERILRTVGSPACIAKNSYGLPVELPLSWEAFITAWRTQLHRHRVSGQEIAIIPPPTVKCRLFL